MELPAVGRESEVVHWTLLYGGIYVYPRDAKSKMKSLGYCWSHKTLACTSSPLLRGYAKVEYLSIEIDFICKVAEIKLEKGWCYVSYSNCAKKLQRTVLFFTCLPCNNTNAVSVLRYRVEMSIADETGEALFVCFGGVITKLHNMKAYGAGHLLAGEGVNRRKLRPHQNHQTFTVSRFLNECDREPQPAFVDIGGDDDNGDDNPSAVSVPAKVEAGGSSQVEGASDKIETFGSDATSDPNQANAPTVLEEGEIYQELSAEVAAVPEAIVVSNRFASLARLYQASDGDQHESGDDQVVEYGKNVIADELAAVSPEVGTGLVSDPAVDVLILHETSVLSEIETLIEADVASSDPLVISVPALIVAIR
ncbi:hypothetical protein YC2023_090316 [Brassica napus]